MIFEADINTRNEEQEDHSAAPSDARPVLLPLLRMRRRTKSNEEKRARLEEAQRAQRNRQASGRRASGESSAAAEEQLEWVEVELLDENDKPIVDEHCIVTLPDGFTQFTYQTDGRGIVRLDRLVRGRCTFAFPDLDEDVVEQS